jgi:hypothetical protein
MPATVTYPLAVTAGLEVTRINRVLADTFEDGSGSARRLWADRTFKRRFRIQHAPLLATELDALEGFYSRRNGPYDSFWFRDNVFRRGNAEVRFAGPLRIAQSRGVRTVEVELEEIAPIVQNPTLFELRTVLQMTPLWWWDANRALFYRHVDPASLYFESAVDCTVGTHKPVWLRGEAVRDGAAVAELSPGAHVLCAHHWQCGAEWRHAARLHAVRVCAELDIEHQTGDRGSGHASSRECTGFGLIERQCL